jgi:RNA recognition motif-containing protein
MMEEENVSKKARVLEQIKRHLQDSSEEKIDLPTATSILVSGIAKDLHENTEDLFHYFSRMGQIKRILPKSNRQLEIVYVRRSSALEAVQRLNGTSFQGHLLNVQFKQQVTTSNRHSSLPPSQLNRPRPSMFPNRKSTLGRRQRNFRYVQILDDTIT